MQYEESKMTQQVLQPNDVDSGGEGGGNGEDPLNLTELEIE